MSWRNLVSAVAVVGLCGGAVAVATVAQSTTDTGAVAADSAAVRDFLRAARLSCPMVTAGDDRPVVAAASSRDPRTGCAGTVVINRSDGKPLTRIAVPGATAQTTKGGTRMVAEGAWRRAWCPPRS